MSEEQNEQPVVGHKCDRCGRPTGLRHAVRAANGATVHNAGICPECFEECIGAAAVEPEQPSNVEQDRVRCAARGSAALAWQDVPARAGWWWWDDGDNEMLMVRVVNEAGELIAHWSIPIGDSYMTCSAHVSRCLGWWAGPVEPPRSQLLGTPPNAEICGEGAAPGSKPTKATPRPHEKDSITGTR